MFLVGSNYIHTDDDHGRLIEFLSQILKLTNNCPILFYGASLVSRFVFWANPVAHLCLQYVLRFELRH